MAANIKLAAELAAEKDTGAFWVDPTQIQLGTNSRIEEEPGQDAADITRAASIATDGQRVPCLVYRSNGKLVLAGGFGRLRSVLKLREGFSVGEEKYHEPERKLLVRIDSNIVDDKSAFVASVIENVRDTVNPYNVALAQKKLREEYGYSDTQISNLYGYNNTNAVARGKKLLETTEDVQKAVKTGKLSLSAALDVAKLPAEEQKEAIKQVAAGDKVTTASIAEKKAEKIEKGEEDANAASPRNAAALKKFIERHIEEQDDVPTDIQRLFGAIKAFLNGTVTEKTILNRIKEIK